MLWGSNRALRSGSSRVVLWGNNRVPCSEVAAECCALAAANCYAVGQQQSLGSISKTVPVETGALGNH